MTNHTEPTDGTTILLVPGHWLGAWAWDEVVDHLTAAGRHAVPLTLPGLDATDAERASATLDDQVAAVERAIHETGAGRPVVVVAHSGANAPVSLVLDRHPEQVRRVVWVDSGPVAPGTVLAPDAVGELPLPPFEALGQQASLDGLDDAALERFRARAVPEPVGVLRQAVELTDDARLRVPTTLVCCSLPGAQVMELAGAGHPVFAEVARLHDVDVVDLPTGHWPMWSRPADLARVIAAAAS
ncbi:alpha/beta fold hydrolase [Cellulomonas sp. NPDC058312]|uniref:alpha/beta fold hydrolase n=1 Tax=Cellulomonas sp. NPDC058312 TaxID=3346441 RepID=UPI0036E472B5